MLIVSLLVLKRTLLVDVNAALMINIVWNSSQAWALGSINKEVRKWRLIKAEQKVKYCIEDLRNWSEVICLSIRWEQQRFMFVLCHVRRTASNIQKIHLCRTCSNFNPISLHHHRKDNELKLLKNKKFYVFHILIYSR